MVLTNLNPSRRIFPYYFLEIEDNEGGVMENACMMLHKFNIL